MIVDEFGSTSEYQKDLIMFLRALAENALPLLAAPNGMVENPDTVDDLFRLCSRWVSWLLV